MLVELAVTNLGVIEELRLLLGAGLCAVTGETGAGKTMLVEAIDLLVGGRADPVLVRPGATEAVVEGRFVVDDAEVVLARVVPADGRSRAYIDGRLAPAAALAERGAKLVDLHGQHAHQSLLATATQRAALDQFGEIDLSVLGEARRHLAGVERALGELGGDARARAREIDLLRFQVDELAAAGLEDPDEDSVLALEEATLSDAVAHREAALAAVESLTADGGAADALGTALAAVTGRAPFASAETRLRSLVAEASDVAGELRASGEAVDEDPARLAEIRERRNRLHELRRKYGETLAEVMAYGVETAARLAELEQWEERAERLDRERAAAEKAVAKAAAAVAQARRAVAPRLAAEVQAHLVGLAMGSARLGVEVGGPDPGDQVAFLLAANPGSPLLPLTKVASGGELARAMLALRLVLTGVRDDTAPPTLLFDEVDAGIGGGAASAVGQALAELAGERQVLVVTHLAQVAALAGTHLRVAKASDARSTVTTVARLEGEDRVGELARMLSGSPESAAARHHAAELLGDR